jgi:acetyl-CoA carboxylase biotin carboxyl carrier protein
VTGITTAELLPIPPTPANEAPAHDGHELIAPMVGTFYAGSAPGSSPFVEIGTEVEIGDTLCIIEAMKMMNQIESDARGRITKILAENGDPIEFGQVLFIIKE